MKTTTLNRRSWMRSTSLGGLACLSSSAWTSLLTAAAEQAKAKACILIFLEGGPSQLDTFDPKPGTPTGGPFEAIDTAITGIKFAQHVPKLAAMADKLAILRTLNSNEGDHERAQSLIHTGYKPNPRLAYPAMGSTVAWQMTDPAVDVPAFVSIGPKFETSILGPRFSPFVIEDTNNPAPELTLTDGISNERMQRRLTALEAFNSKFSDRFQSPLGGDLTQLSRRADRMRKSEIFQPYNPAESEPELFEKYGSAVNDGFLARACLTARRLVESGVKFVEIQYGGWDTHDDNFTQVQNLSASLDAGMSTLITDLEQRGLLNSTLLVCVGEFGRTPTINGNNGRDHFPDLFSALLAGGGIKAGQALGESNEGGTEIKDRPLSIQDFHATIFTALGLDVKKDYFAPDGRLLRLTNNGQPISDLLG